MERDRLMQAAIRSTISEIARGLSLGFVIRGSVPSCPDITCAPCPDCNCGGITHINQQSWSSIIFQAVLTVTVGFVCYLWGVHRASRERLATPLVAVSDISTETGVSEEEDIRTVARAQVARVRSKYG